MMSNLQFAKILKDQFRIRKFGRSRDYVMQLNHFVYAGREMPRRLSQKQVIGLLRHKLRATQSSIINGIDANLRFLDELEKQL